ncbi:MAG: PAS domain-containing protein [Oceanicaulis sp.]
MLIDDLYEQVFNASPMGMAIIDRNHRVLRTNPAMDRISGRKAEPGEPGAQVTPHIAETVRAYVDTVFQTKIAPEPVRLMGRTDARDGASSEWHCAFTPIAAETGARVELCLAVITDLGGLHVDAVAAAELDADRKDLAAIFADNVVPHPAALTRDDA